MNFGTDSDPEQLEAARLSDRPASIEPGTFTGAIDVAGNTIAQMAAAIPWGISAAASGAAGMVSPEFGAAMMNRTEHLYGRAMDYWTPDPRTVGAGGEVVGKVLGTLPALLLGPAAMPVLAGTTTAAEGRRLAQAGVEGPAAGGVAAVQGAVMAFGIVAPAALGSTLAARVASGAGINVALGAAGDAASGALLDGTPQGEQYDPFNLQARTIDALLGAAFGGFAHWKARGDFDRQMSSADRDAIMAAANHDNLVNRTGPGRPATEIDAGRQADNVNAAVRQLVETGAVDPAALPHQSIDYRDGESNAVPELRAIADEEGAIDTTPAPEADLIAAALRDMPTGDPAAEPVPVVEPKFADSPDVAAVRDALAADEGLRGMKVMDDAGNEIPIGDMVEQSVQTVSDAEKLDTGFKAAAACFLRTLA